MDKGDGGDLGPPLDWGLGSGCRVWGRRVQGGRVRWDWLGLDCSLPGFAVAYQPYGRRFCALLFAF